MRELLQNGVLSTSCALLGRSLRRSLKVLVIALLAANVCDAVTVRQSIESMRITPVGASARSLQSDGSVLFSPDHAHFIVETARGNLQKDVVDQRLVVFASTEIGAWLNRKNAGEVPIGHEIAHFAVADEVHAIASLQWIDNQHLAFLAANAGGASQVFEVNVLNGKLDQLTNSADNIAKFAIGGGELVYFSVVPVPFGDSTLVNDKVPSQLIGERDEFWSNFFPLLKVSVIDLASHRTSDIAWPAMRIRNDFQHIWVAPSGHFAVLLLPATDAPTDWSRYRVPQYDFFGYASDRKVADPASEAAQFRLRYVLLDLRNGKTKPLLNAPSGVVTAHAPLNVFWPDQDQSVIVTRSYVPLDNDTSGASIEQRLNDTAILQVDLKGLGERVIAWEADVADAKPCADQAAPQEYWDSASSALVVDLKRADCATQGEAMQLWSQSFELSGGRWISTRFKPRDEVALRVRLDQDFNVPPRLTASTTECRCSAPFLLTTIDGTDDTAKAREFRWRDRNGISWRGALLLPRPGTVRAGKLPAVIQTHGYTPREYLVDGPDDVPTAFAARPLADAGFVLLQVEENRQASTNDTREPRLFAEGMRAAVQALVEQENVDPARVGVTAWSRTGIHTVEALTTDPGLFATAVLSDVGWGTYYANMFLVDDPPNMKAQEIELFGPSPDFGNISAYFASRAMYKLSRTNTPIRLEAMGVDSLIFTWEAYSVIKSGGGVVDFNFLPRASHVLFKPGERLASQGGAVDWFRFWLQGYEDPDPGKRAQYVRWERFRTARLANERAQ